MTILNVGTPLTCGHPAAIMAPSELDPPGMSDDFYHASVVTLTTNIDDARNRIAASTTEHLNQLRRKVEVDVEWMKKETEARFVQLECEAKEARELIATLRAELTNAEKKEAMAVAELRSHRAAQGRGMEAGCMCVCVCVCRCAPRQRATADARD